MEALRLLIKNLFFGASLCLLSVSLFLIPLERTWAGEFRLEGGLVGIGFFPTGTDTDSPFPGVGFSGSFAYEIDRWGFGVRVQNTVSTSASFHFVAQQYNISGDLARRNISLCVYSRFFFRDQADQRGWYLEGSLVARNLDLIHADSVYQLPNSPDYTRIFLTGGGFSWGAGYRPKHGPFFFQLNYELVHFETLQLVGSRSKMHRIYDESNLNENYFLHIIYFTTGLNIL